MVAHRLSRRYSVGLSYFASETNLERVVLSLAVIFIVLVGY